MQDRPFRQAQLLECELLKCEMLEGEISVIVAAACGPNLCGRKPL